MLLPYLLCNGQGYLVQEITVFKTHWYGTLYPPEAKHLPHIKINLHYRSFISDIWVFLYAYKGGLVELQNTLQSGPFSSHMSTSKNKKICIYFRCPKNLSAPISPICNHQFHHCYTNKKHAAWMHTLQWYTHQWLLCTLQSTQDKKRDFISCLSLSCHTYFKLKIVQKV